MARCLRCSWLCVHCAHSGAQRGQQKQQQQHIQTNRARARARVEAAKNAALMSTTNGRVIDDFWLMARVRASLPLAYSKSRAPIVVT